MVWLTINWFPVNGPVVSEVVTMPFILVTHHWHCHSHLLCPHPIDMQLHNDSAHSDASLFVLATWYFWLTLKLSAVCRHILTRSNAHQFLLIVWMKRDWGTSGRTWRDAGMSLKLPGGMVLMPVASVSVPLMLIISSIVGRTSYLNVVSISLSSLN